MAQYYKKKKTKVPPIHPKRFQTSFIVAFIVICAF